MEFNDLLIVECDGVIYGGRFNAEGEFELYRLNKLGEWEKVTEV